MLASILYQETTGVVRLLSLGFASERGMAVRSHHRSQQFSPHVVITFSRRLGSNSVSIGSSLSTL